MSDEVRDDEKVDRWVAHHPPADISPAEFEQFVADVLGAGGTDLANYTVQTHEVISGADGDFDFDATIRFSHLGMDYLTIVEAKRHKNPIKRELVQVLHSKAQSVGAHKAVMIATAPFQRGAIEFAKAHGIALVLVSEGRFTFETRAAEPRPVMSRQEAQERYGLPTFVGVGIGPGSDGGGTTFTTFDTTDCQRIQEVLFNVQTNES